MPVQPFDKTQGKPVLGASPANVSAQKSPIAPGHKRLNDLVKIPTEALFSGVGQILFLASVVVFIGVVVFFLGFSSLGKSSSVGVSKKVGSLVPPINVAEIYFPSGRQQDLFLKNFQDAGKTRDFSTRYKLLEDDYTMLLGFYTQDHDLKTRKVLEQYSQYMVSNYPDQAQKSIYTVPCYDSGCGTAKYPQEIQKIKDSLKAASASASLKDSANKSFEAAALSSDKARQGANYLDAFIAIRNEYRAKKDTTVKSIAQQLLDFIKSNYPDDFRRYQSITGGKVEL